MPQHSIEHQTSCARNAPLQPGCRVYSAAVAASAASACAASNSMKPSSVESLAFLGMLQQGSEAKTNMEHQRVVLVMILGGASQRHALDALALQRAARYEQMRPAPRQDSRTCALAAGDGPGRMPAPPRPAAADATLLMGTKLCAAAATVGSAAVCVAGAADEAPDCVGAPSGAGQAGWRPRARGWGPCNSVRGPG